MSKSSDSEIGNTPMTRIEEIDVLIENLTKSLQSLHKVVRAKLEPKFLLAKMRREKLQALMTMSKIQYVYSEIETLLTTKELVNKLEGLVDESKQRFNEDLREKLKDTKKRRFEELETDLHDDTTAGNEARPHQSAKRQRSSYAHSSASKGSKTEEITQDPKGTFTCCCNCNHNPRRRESISSTSSKKSTDTKSKKSNAKPAKEISLNKGNTSTKLISESKKVKEKSVQNKVDSDEKKEKSDTHKEKSDYVNVKSNKTKKNETKAIHCNDKSDKRSKTSDKTKGSCDESNITSDKDKEKPNSVQKETKENCDRAKKTSVSSKEKKSSSRKQSVGGTEKSKHKSRPPKESKSKNDTSYHGSNNPYDKSEVRTTNTEKSLTKYNSLVLPVPKVNNINGIPQLIMSIKSHNLPVPCMEKANLKKFKDSRQTLEPIENYEEEKSFSNNHETVDVRIEGVIDKQNAEITEIAEDMLEISVKTELDIEPYLKLNSIASRLQFENDSEVIPRYDTVSDVSFNNQDSNDFPNNLQADSNNNCNNRTDHSRDTLKNDSEKDGIRQNNISSNKGGRGNDKNTGDCVNCGCQNNASKHFGNIDTRRINNLKTDFVNNDNFVLDSSKSPNNNDYSANKMNEILRLTTTKAVFGKKATLFNKLA